MTINFGSIILGIVIIIVILVAIFAVKLGRIKGRSSQGLSTLKTDTIVQMFSYNHDIHKEIYDVKQYYQEKSQDLDLSSHGYFVHPIVDNGLLLEVAHHIWIYQQQLQLFPSKDMLTDYYTLQFNGIVLTKFHIENIHQINQNLGKYATEMVVINDLAISVTYLFELNDFYVFEKLFQSFKLASPLK